MVSELPLTTVSGIEPIMLPSEPAAVPGVSGTDCFDSDAGVDAGVDTAVPGTVSDEGESDPHEASARAGRAARRAMEIRRRCMRAVTPVRGR